MKGPTSPAGERGQAKQLEPASTARDAARRSSLLRAAQRGDRTARDELVTSNLGLVRSVAARYRDLGLPFDDLVQEGAIGLLDAIDHYDPGRGASFESYSRFRIRRAIRNALTDKARLIRLPKQVVERRRAIERAEARLTAAAAGRTPSPAEIASVTGLSVAAVRRRAARPERCDRSPRRARSARRLSARGCGRGPASGRPGAHRARARADEAAGGRARGSPGAAAADRQFQVGHRTGVDAEPGARLQAGALAASHADDRPRCSLRAPELARARKPRAGSADLVVDPSRRLADDAEQLCLGSARRVRDDAERQRQPQSRCGGWKTSLWS